MRARVQPLLLVAQSRSHRGNELGSIALVMSSTSNARWLWRFYDSPGEAIDFAKARWLSFNSRPPYKPSRQYKI